MRLPYTTAARTLIPGKTLAVPAPHADVSLGDSIVSAFAEPGAPAPRVGTRSKVVERRTEESPPLLKIRGLALVAISDVRDGWAEVAEIPTGESTASPATVEQDLRAYMAARSEAGLFGDVHARLSSNPELASHQVASLLQVSSPEIQELFEAGDAAARLDRASAMLRRETLLLRATMGSSH
jgi:hypothetical protein